MNGRLFASLVVIGALSGCDQDIIPVPFDRKRVSETQRQEAEAQQRERDAAMDRLQGERRSFRVRLSAAAAVVSNENDRIVRDVDKLTSDRQTLSERIKTLTRKGSSSGGDDRVEAVLALLDDDVVNELALRHLGHDFRLVRLELSDAIVDLNQKTRQRETALAANQAAYDAQLKDARAEKELTRESTQQAKEKLRKEIADYEDRRLKLKKRLQFVSASERKQLESELNAFDSQLRQMRSSYDGMRSNRAVTDERSRAGRDEERLVESAVRRRAEEDARVQRRFAGQKDRSSVVSEYEAKTVLVLEKAMNERFVRLRESQTLARKALVGIRAMAAGVDGLDETALKNSRVELDGLIEKISSSN